MEEKEAAIEGRYTTVEGREVSAEKKETIIDGGMKGERHKVKDIRHKA